MATTSVGYDGGAVVVYVSVPDEKVAKALATGIIEKKLAACVSAVPGIALISLQVSEDCLIHSCRASGHAVVQASHPIIGGTIK